MKKQVLFIKAILLFFLFVLVRTVVFAQANNSAITGSIQDKLSKQPIEFATVQLLRSADSSVIKTAITDKKGRFTLDNVADSKYVLRCSFIGYEIVLMPITVNQRKENVG